MAAVAGFAKAFGGDNASSQQHPTPSSAPLATTKIAGGTSKASFNIEDDFMYGATAASCHIAIRMDFMRKVYAIVAAQLLFTTTVCALFINMPALSDFLLAHSWLLQLTSICTLVVAFSLGVVSKRYPLNVALLTALTVLISISVGFVVSMYTTASVLKAVALTTGIFVGLTAFTFQTKFDFTVFNSTLYIALWTMIILGFAQYFFPFSSGAQMLFSVCGALLFCAFIVVDTQLLMNKVSADEFVLCAVHLYLDIINLFLYILRLLGDRK